MLQADDDEINPEPEASPPPSKPKSKKPSRKVSSLAALFYHRFKAPLNCVAAIPPLEKTFSRVGRRRRRRHRNLIIHLDVKTSNVMLDFGYNARLGDFGLDRWLKHDALGLSTRSISVNNNCQFRMTETSRIDGTIGYLPPENFQKRGMATAKLDVFSFGVVVLEVATGRRRWTSLTLERRGGRWGLIKI
ncbi:hypothetical protein J5N97_016328 [Dioscorea zingiberensis]|uniref:Protein kinase domain-containing protein n=1 Tax=Dioscorea zingiberensis TaxID=325984 RepID=A0A9D5CKU2_9LILI|nr:hypothetical protein J5N97_016328 [Dioscorea zingiberensis]